MALQVFLFAILLVSAQTQAKSVDVDSERSLSEELQKALEKFVEQVKEAIAAAKIVVADLLESLKGEAKEELIKALEQLEKIAAKVQSELEALKEEAAKLGQEAQECLQTHQGALQALQTEAVKGVIACHTNALANLKGLIAKSIGDLQGAVGLATGIVDEWKNCDGVFCHIAIIGKIPSVYKEVQTTIKTVIDGFKATGSSEIAKYGTCVKSNVHNFVDGSQKIAAEVNNCIEAIGSA